MLKTVRNQGNQTFRIKIGLYPSLVRIFANPTTSKDTARHHTETIGCWEHILTIFTLQVITQDLFLFIYLFIAVLGLG